MATHALSTVTVWSPDPGALSRVRAHVAEPAAGRPGLFRRPPVPPQAFSLEAVVPTGMDVDAWDGDRAVALWGTGRPEAHSTLELDGPDRLVYGLVTAYAPPHAALRALSAAHPEVVVHAVATCGSEFASTAWFVRGRVVDEQERELELTEEQWEDWDGEWDLPDTWAFDSETARRLAADG